MADTQTDPRLAYWQQQQQLLQSNLIKFQLDATTELETLREDLLGLEYDEEGNIITDIFDKEGKVTVIKKTRQELINQDGANMILSFLRPRITKIVSLSNLDSEDIRNRCLAYIDDLTFLLNRHYKEFNIKSFQIMDNIIDLCDDLLFTTFMKSYKAGERDTLRKQFTMVESQEHIQDNRVQPKLPFSNPFNRGG